MARFPNVRHFAALAVIAIVAVWVPANGLGLVFPGILFGQIERAETAGWRGQSESDGPDADFGPSRQHDHLPARPVPEAVIFRPVPDHSERPSGEGEIVQTASPVRLPSFPEVDRSTGARHDFSRMRSNRVRDSSSRTHPTGGFAEP